MIFDVYYIRHPSDVYDLRRFYSTHEYILWKKFMYDLQKRFGETYEVTRIEIIKPFKQF